MMVNKITRPTRIICGANFRISAPILDITFEKVAFEFVILVSLMCTRREIEDIILAKLFFLYFTRKLTFTQYDNPV